MNEKHDFLFQIFHSSQSSSRSHLLSPTVDFFQRISSGFFIPVQPNLANIVRGEYIYTKAQKKERKRNKERKMHVIREIMGEIEIIIFI